MTAKKQEVVAGHEAIAKTGISALHVKRKVQNVSTRVEVGRPVKKRRVIVVLSLEAQRKPEVEAVRAVMARIGAEVVQEIAARPEALHQAQIETKREVVAIQPSVPQVLQRTRIIVVLRAVTKTRAIRQVMARVTISYKAQKERNHEAVHGRILRAVTKLVEATHAVLRVHAAGHHLLASHVARVLVKDTRNHGADLPIKSRICVL